MFEYANELLSRLEQDVDFPMIKEAARKLCIDRGIDPDKPAKGQRMICGPDDSIFHGCIPGEFPMVRIDPKKPAWYFYLSTAGARFYDARNPAAHDD